MRLAAAILLVACGCEKASDGGGAATTRELATPATIEEALERVRRLDLAAGVELAGWPEVGAVAIRTGVMQPSAGLALWYRLRAAQGALAMAPIVVDASLDLADVEVESPAEALARSRTLSADRFFRERLAELEKSRALGDPFLPELRALERVDIPARPARAPALYFARQNEEYARMEERNPGLEMPTLSVRVALLAVPATDLPAYLRFGGFNECPMPHEHIAVLAEWRRRHGAELVFVGGDTLELLVARPAVTREQVAALTREQFLYCEDIVTQGVGDAAALARELGGAGSWFFWWD